MDKIITEREFDVIVAGLPKIVKLQLDDEAIKDLKNIARGVYAPVQGFMREKDMVSVSKDMRLSSGEVWPIPIVLDVDKDNIADLKGAKRIILVDQDATPIGILSDPEIYRYDKKKYVHEVFGTDSRDHPGVNEVLNMNDYLIGGEVQLIDHHELLFPDYNLTPEETQNRFNLRGWNKVVAFQTRNVPHRGHEFLQKEALKEVDGLFIQPVIGRKKISDFKDEYILSSYEILIDKYYPSDRAMLGILPIRMRYAGPREAVMHALIRQNYGCTHFIVGRDHAGVKDFYDPYAAQEIFDEFSREELSIEIMKFPEIVYDKSRKVHCFVDDCKPFNKVKFSGTKMRSFISEKKQPPEYILRPEIYNILVKSDSTMVDADYQEKSVKQQKGFVLWFTGLSQSGKSTIASQVYDILRKDGYRTERLDGDIVRETLTRDLGFSKKDRDENIRRVGFVAKMLSRNGVAVVASFISPYKRQRDELKIKIPNFIEVYVDTPLEICEKRDKKGLYAKARAGEIKNFTGISAPYEEPQDPDIVVDAVNLSPEENAEAVIDYLRKYNYIN